ncbi:MAG: PEP-CTERM sorting domain-containing protein [Acidobacteria bacterium]|nr:PEP-CTERM sorting domain-containing protein [Acidobacteriota bacterium]
MKLKLFVVFISSALCAFLATASPASEAYKMIDLGVSGDSMAFSINSNEQVVGRRMSGGSFLWQNGSLQTLGGIARAINDSAQVVITAGSETYLWQSGSLQDIGAGDAIAINSSTQILMSSYAGDALLWQSGVTADIGAFSPLGLNDSGQILGFDGGALIWQAGSVQYLGSDIGYAYAINNLAQVAAAERSNGHIVMWQNGSVQDLGLDSMVYHPVSINDDGQLVGWTNSGDMWVWQGGNTALLDPTPGYTFLSPEAMNDNGWICGEATDSSGMDHTVLWEPIPEPSSLIALALGLLPLAGVWRRRMQAP